MSAARLHPKNLMTFFYDVIGRLNAAEATVLSFFLMSLIGGGVLWYVESGREVRAKEPVLQAVTVEPTSEIGDDITMEPRNQVHTVTKDVTYKGEKFIDTLFTAVSALCVTGLTSSDFSQFTLTGQIITLVLIQMGGLGIIVFTSIFALLIMRGLSERQSFRDLLAGILDTDVMKVRHMLRHVITYTILIEGTAFLIMGLHLYDADPALMQGANPWWWSLFHSVSAFNNAGFSLNSNNLMNFATDPVINLTIAGLIILGGIGYPVLIAIHAWSRHNIFRLSDKVQKELNEEVKDVVASSVQTRVALYGAAALLLLGTVIPLALEWHNPIMQDFTFSQRLLAAFFQSTSTRTAGFNTVDIGALGTATLFLYMILMYIGANPAGTGGGIKIPTVAVLYGYIKDWFKKPGLPVTLFGRSISKFALSHAIRLFFFSILFIGLITFAMSAIEAPFLRTPDPLFNYTKVLFEIFSAFGTVGLSMGFPEGVTSFSAILHPLSKFLLILTMLFGRLGPLTILAALPWKRRVNNEPLSPDYPNTQKIQIG